MRTGMLRYRTKPQQVHMPCVGGRGSHYCTVLLSTLLNCSVGQLHRYLMPSERHGCFARTPLPTSPHSNLGSVVKVKQHTALSTVTPVNCAVYATGAAPKSAPCSHCTAAHSGTATPTLTTRHSPHFHSPNAHSPRIYCWPTTWPSAR
jgi:hypothetical protein